MKSIELFSEDQLPAEKGKSIIDLGEARA